MNRIAKIVITITIILIISAPVKAQGAQDYTYYYNLGYAKLVDGSFDDAINIFDQTLALKPDCAEAYLGLGIAYRQLKQLDKALFATRKALEYDPEYYKAYYNLGLILEELGNKQDALEAYKVFSKRVPESRNIPELKGKIEQLRREI